MRSANRKIWGPLHAIVALLLLGLGHSAMATEAFCQPVRMEEKTWPFKIVAKIAAPVWSGEQSAKDLLRMQTQYFSQKTGPFASKSVFPTLSFYDPHLEFRIDPEIRYSKTIAGNICVSVVGATLVAEATPTIYLASEMAERSCVAEAALKHQLRHDKITKLALADLEKKSEKFKAAIFAVYSTRGAAGRSQSDLEQSMKRLQAESVETMQGTFMKFLRGNRASQVEHRGNLSDLASSCGGMFQKYSEELTRN